jgi:hypothetical protein
MSAPTIRFKWNIKGYCESGYVRNTVNRRIFNAYVIYLNNCPIDNKSKGQKTAAMSSEEAE